MFDFLRWWWRQPALRLAFGFTAALALTLAAPRARAHDTVVATIVVSLVGLLAAQLVLAVRGRRRRASLGFDVQIISAHWIQAICQSSVYVYWGWFWPKIYAWFPLLLAQLFFLFALGILISLARKGRASLVFSPVPIIISTNLFLWFKDDWFYLQFATVAFAAIAKELFRWQRDGRSMHIFNPSAFALTVAALLLIATGTTSSITWGEELAAQLARPPHIELVIFALGLIVMTRFSVTLMTLAAVASLWALNTAYTAATGLYWFVDQGVPIPVLLGMTFLFTDPATSPRSGVGRVVYGIAYGGTVFGAYGVLSAAGLPLFYDKLLSVPLMNLCVRWIEALVARARVMRLDVLALAPARFNRVHLGVYVGVFGAALAVGQVGRGHPGNSLPFWKQMASERRGDAPRLYAGLLKTAAVEGNGSAANEYGLLLLKGELLPADAAEASRWFARSCALDTTEGCLNIAVRRVFHGEALELEADVQHAFDALERGARDGGAQPAFVLGSAYETGHGRPRDPSRAIALLEQAGLAGVSQASARLGQLFSLGAEGVDEDHARAAVWLERAAKADDPVSCAALGILYLNGDGVVQDVARARALIEKASSLGHPKAREWAAALGPEGTPAP